MNPLDRVKEIDAILAELRYFWTKHPNQSFGQIAIKILLSSEEISDEDVLTYLQERRRVII